MYMWNVRFLVHANGKRDGENMKERIREKASKKEEVKVFMTLIHKMTTAVDQLAHSRQ